jgi:hypothetical protein
VGALSNDHHDNSNALLEEKTVRHPLAHIHCSFFSLSLSLSLTHTHTHSLTLALPTLTSHNHHLMNN